MIKYLKLLLWPFSLIYGAVTDLRNYLYSKGVFKVTRFDFPVIAVGNLTVGGTGKTPHVEYLIRLLAGYKLATLSRGYKRKTQGFILADAQSTAAQIGDEPFQYHRDYPAVTVAVSEKRVEGIQKLKQQLPNVAAVILDDAMQHRAVKPSLLIMLTDFNRPFFKDFILPAGLLRESRLGAERADIVVVSKCPPKLSASERDKYISKIKKYTLTDTPIYFSTFRYGEPVSIGNDNALQKNVILLTGIANPLPLQQYLTGNGYQILKSFIFPDHHTYTIQDLHNVKNYIEGLNAKQVSVITTSKDAVKLTDDSLKGITKELPIFYLPIEVEFLNDAGLFDKSVLEHVRQMIPTNKK